MAPKLATDQPMSISPAGHIRFRSRDHNAGPQAQWLCGLVYSNDRHSAEVFPIPVLLMMLISA